MQDKGPIAYFNEKFNGDVLNYSTYDKVLYALVGPSSPNSFHSTNE